MPFIILVIPESANRLSVVSGPSFVVGYSYNGLGDRVSQTSDGNPANYALDIAAGLTQALADEEYAYLYGVGRISQHGVGSTDYFLVDALGRESLAHFR